MTDSDLGGRQNFTVSDSLFCIASACLHNSSNYFLERRRIIDRVKNAHYTGPEPSIAPSNLYAVNMRGEADADAAIAAHWA